MLLLLLLPFAAMAQSGRGVWEDVSDGDVVILYENDVHGAMEGYPLLAALRDGMRGRTPYVCVVSSGDFMSGCAIGAMSKGRYPIRMMNAVGYDYVVPGNHEFDFGIDTMMKRFGELGATVLCGNFAHVASGRSFFPCSALVRYGEVTVAFVGITTPSTITTSTPHFFQDSAGDWAYTFFGSRLDSVLQGCVDDVRREGADCVVLLAHVGDGDLPPLVAATEGIDVVLDGHSHSVIPHTLLRNRVGKEVLWTSTGTKFEHIGLLVVPREGKVWNRLIPTAELRRGERKGESEKRKAESGEWKAETLYKNIKEDENIDARAVEPWAVEWSEALPASSVTDTMLALQRAFVEFGMQPVGVSRMHIGREPTREGWLDSPMGNLFCDAYCWATGAEIAFCNSGSMREDLPEGPVNHGDVFAAAPFANQLCVVEVSGNAIVDALEMGCRRYPVSEGEFPQVGGLIFEIDTAQPSGVVVDGNGLFLRVEGSRRVANVRVWSEETRSYVPIEDEKLYRVAGCDYTLIYHGDGYNFAGMKVIDDKVCDYLAAVERYISDCLGGTIDSYYSSSQGRIRLRERRTEK